MFKNRFNLIIVALFVLVASLAVSVPFSNARKSADLSGLPRPVIVPVTGANEFSDYFARHPGLRRGLPTSIYTILDHSLIDECFDVSLSEIAACREASQSASQ